MKFQEYDLVRILKDCEEGVRKGEVGTVLLSFENPVEAYEVEFLEDVYKRQEQGPGRERKPRVGKEGGPPLSRGRLRVSDGLLS